MNHSVDVLRGNLVLGGKPELDFVLDAPLPLVWQRKYVSENAFADWLGQGWGLPAAERMEIVFNGVNYVDARGVRTLFPDIRVGEEFYSQYRHITLRRTARNAYEIVIEDGGVRLCFGLLPWVAGSKESLLGVIKEALVEGEVAIRGVGHAEETLLNELEKRMSEWKPIAGAASRNVCTAHCEPAIIDSEGILGGEVFPRHRKDKTDFRLFWWE